MASLSRWVMWSALTGAGLLGCDGTVDPPRQPLLPDTGRAQDGGSTDGGSPAADAAAQDAAPVELDRGVADGDVTDDAGPVDGAGPDATVPPPLPGWRLTWHDEFDGPAGTPPDPTRWTHDVGGDGWGNAQLEYNTDRPENAQHDGEGRLVITARREAYRGNAYTSARIKTQGLFAQRYGRFEASIQLPIGQGMWPAFWMLGDDIGDVGWPVCGEIDVMEFRGQRPRESTGALHGPGYSAGQAIYAAYASPTRLPDDFHLFAVEWGPDGIEWTVDGQVFHTVSPGDQPPGARWVYDHPFFLILNLAVGGTFVGSPDGNTVFPQAMYVDYVRVYSADP